MCGTGWEKGKCSGILLYDSQSAIELSQHNKYEYVNIMSQVLY